MPAARSAPYPKNAAYSSGDRKKLPREATLRGSKRARERLKRSSSGVAGSSTSPTSGRSVAGTSPGDPPTHVTCSRAAGRFTRHPLSRSQRSTRFRSRGAAPKRRPNSLPVVQRRYSGLAGSCCAATSASSPASSRPRSATIVRGSDRPAAAAGHIPAPITRMPSTAASVFVLALRPAKPSACRSFTVRSAASTPSHTRRIASSTPGVVRDVASSSAQANREPRAVLSSPRSVHPRRRALRRADR